MHSEKNISIDLKKYCSINDIWESEANLEWSKRKILFNFQTGSLVQGNYMVKEFYLKLKECNICIGYSEELLKNLFLRGLSPENEIKVLMDSLQTLVLDEIVKRLSSEQ